MKFKKGDKVVVTASDSELRDIDADDLQSGYVGCITRVGAIAYDYQIDGFSSGWVNHGMIELYKPISNFYSTKQKEGKEEIELKITKTIKNDNVIVVFWNDETKTVVKRSVNEVNDLEKAAMAICAKKLFGSYSKFKEGMSELFEVKDVSVGITSISKATSFDPCVYTHSTPCYIPSYSHGLEKPKLELVMKLRDRIESYGAVGTPTNLFLQDRRLFIGDVIDNYDYTEFIVGDNDYNYIMGYQVKYNDSKGVTYLPNGFRFVKSYKDLMVGYELRDELRCNITVVEKG